MNFTKVLSNIKSKVSSSVGPGVYTNLMPNAPLANLMKPILNWQNTLRSRIQGYDALALGMSSLDSVLNDVADYEVGNTTVLPTFSECTEEEYSAFVSGIEQASKIIPNASELLTVTSSAGLQYSLQITNGNVFSIDADGHLSPVAVVSDGKYLVRVEWVSHSSLDDLSFPSTNNILSHLQKICDYLGIDVSSATSIFDLTILLCSHYEITPGSTVFDNVEAIAQSLELGAYSTINEYLSAIESSEQVPSRIFSSARENFASILSSVVQTGSINAFFIEAIDAMKLSSFGTWINDKMLRLQDFNNSVRTIIKGISQAFAEGGIKGVIGYMYRVLKTTQSITDDSGVFKFTDNSALVPKEYIAGLIGTIAAGAVTVIGAITAMITPVVGALLSMTGGLVWSIFGSVKQDISDTYASLTYVDQDIKQLNIIPCSPIGIFQGEEEVRYFPWYENYYSITSKCAMLDVPGGVMMFGPGKFNSEGHMTHLRFEFHPYGQVISANAAENFGNLFRHGDVNDSLYNVSGKNIVGWWNEHVQDGSLFDSTIVANDGAGHLSASHDKLSRFSTCFCIMVFVTWLCASIADSNARTYTLSDVWTVYNDSAPEMGAILQTGIGYTRYNWATGDALSWSDIASYCNTFNHRPSNTAVAVYSKNNVLQYVHPNGWFIHNYLGTLGVAPATWGGGDYVYTPSNIGDPYDLPDAPDFMITLPKYNSRTFWTYLILTAAITIAVTVSVVVASVKFSKWRTRKRAENVARFNASQSDYQMAVNGEKQVYNPETHQYDIETFDTTTPEGKAYVQSCYKTYKRTAFKNNMLAHIIGGSRYDISTFYGLQEDTDEGTTNPDVQDSVFTSFISSTYGVDEHSVVDQPTQTNNTLSLIRNLIQKVS